MMVEDMLVRLDYHFLRYIDVRPEIQKRNQSFYLHLFEGCHKIVDLGCGNGDFVELLREHGKEAVGVDNDPKTCEMARQRGIPIVCEDVFAYLEGLPSNGLDGIFASHFVEHLPYQEVLRLFELSYQVLRPNGIIVVTTPNVRGLYSHLEMFWLHFGHVSFYHPRLLCFFLEHVGFTEPASGENPYTASPLMSDLRAHFSEPKSKDAPSWNALSSRQPHEGRLTIPIDYQRMLPLQGRSWWCRLSRHAKMFLARMIVQPYLDQLVDRINIVLQETNRMLTSLQIAAAQLRSDNDLIAATNDLIAATLLRLDRPFECYVTARKPRESYQNQNVEV